MNIADGQSGTPQGGSDEHEPGGFDATEPVERRPEDDCFRPPKKNCLVICLHCQEQYDSYKITWVEGASVDGRKGGFWRCPTPGCNGAGFTFDIFPVDPNWEDDEERGFVGGWFDDDGNRVPPPWADPE